MFLQSIASIVYYAGFSLSTKFAPSFCIKIFRFFQHYAVFPILCLNFRQDFRNIWNLFIKSIAKNSNIRNNSLVESTPIWYSGCKSQEFPEQDVHPAVCLLHSTRTKQTTQPAFQLLRCISSRRDVWSPLQQTGQDLWQFTTLQPLRAFPRAPFPAS